MISRLLLGLVFALLAQSAAAGEPLIISPIDEHALAVLGNNVPPQATADNDRGRVLDATDQAHCRVVSPI
jgi:hypothetical protein